MRQKGERGMHSSELIAWRKKHGYTQQELAWKLGTAVATISRWENGISRIPHTVRLALSRLSSRQKPEYRSGDLNPMSG